MDCHEIEAGTDADRRLRRPRRILSVNGPTVRTRLATGLLIVGLLGATPAEAQGLSCGGHRIQWVGGAPAASFDSAGADRSRSSGAPGARFDPQHEDGQQPTIDEPAGMNRERWEALVFDGYDDIYGVEQSFVLDRATVPTIRVCIQSPDTSATTERLAPYSEASWWRQNIERWTGLSWNGDIRIDACTDEPQEGWVHVREGRPGEVPGRTSAHTTSERAGHPHRAGRWLSSQIVLSPLMADVDELFFEQILAHELGHVLGFWHVAPESTYIMSYNRVPVWSEEESSFAQLAYQVGPNIRFPGLVRGGVQVDPDQASADSAALMALYNATGGNSWTDSTNWGTDEPLDRWHGVRIDDAGRVVQLDLHVNNLTGPIPPELGALTNLDTLYLYSNNLTGPIPPELGTLTNLDDLRLNSNNLTGPIPPELGALTNLDDLYLYSNNLTGSIPPELGDLYILQNLWLGINNLTGSIPPELGDLYNLQHLWVGNNNLTGSIPPELGSLINLTGLRAANNQLTGPLPLSMTNLRRLYELDIENNAGLCAPADAAFQEWLATVNTFTGDTCADEVEPTVPDEDPQDRAALMALYDATNGNNWTNSTNWGTDEPFGNWHGVRTDGVGRVLLLELQENNLTGPIPPELGRLSSLRKLYLYSNNLTGSIPRELGALTNLDRLWVAHNNLTGSIPPELGSLTNLTGLWAAFNNLTGPLPSSMTNLGPLDHLHLENNAGLCAPADAAFQAWLARVKDFRGEICADESTPTMLTLSAASAPAEGGNPVTVTATLDNPAPANGMTVTLTTGGTATLDTDYTLSSTTITLAEGETAGTVTITVTDDAEDDDGETIVIDAESTSPPLTAEQLTLTIEDNDETPVPALPLSAAMLLGLLLLWRGAARARMRDRTDIARG